MQVREGRLAAGCGLSRGREDCGGGSEWGWDWLCVQVEAAGASKAGQAGSALWALSRPRGLWEGGKNGVGIACVST